MSNIIASTAAPRLSKPSAMPCKSWSLQAKTTCPGSVDNSHPTGLVPACRTCYAAKGMYHMPNVIAPREHNKQDWRHPDWENQMIQALGKMVEFRWLDSGDVYHVELAKKMLRIMRATPNCKHWLPTRSYKFAKFRPIFARMEKLQNVAVRKSSDSVTGGRIRGKTTSTIIQDISQLGDAYLCPKTAPGLPKNEQNCNAQKCRACWDKTVPVVAYIEH